MMMSSNNEQQLRDVLELVTGALEDILEAASRDDSHYFGETRGHAPRRGEQLVKDFNGAAEDGRLLLDKLKEEEQLASAAKELAAAVKAAIEFHKKCILTPLPKDVLHALEDALAKSQGRWISRGLSERTYRR